MSRKKKDRVIFLVDCQSFYASVEKVAHPEYKNKPLAVAGDPAKRSGIILAACPLAKKFGVSTAETLGEALGKCPDLVLVKPRMQTYIDVSIQITEILQTFTDLVEPYSIDEQFLDVTNTQHLFGNDPIHIAKQIQDKILEETGVYTRVGISYCKTIAKMSCDQFAKKNESGIFVIEKKGDVERVLWSLPIQKMFLVGSRMTKHLKRLGVHTIGELANFRLSVLRKKWGVNGELLWQIANGVDSSPVTPGTHSKQKGIGHQITLPRDYKGKEIEIILQEISELVCRRCRSKSVMGSVVSVSVRGTDFDFPTGFHRQRKMDNPTNVTKLIYDVVLQLFYEHWDGHPVRSLGVSLTQLVDDDVYQLSLFDQSETYRKIEKVTDQLKDKYGDSIILRASSITKAGLAYDRDQRIGGHMK